MNLENLHDALRRYTAYYGPDEAHAHLIPADVPAAKGGKHSKLELRAGNMLNDASQRGYAMDYLTYSKIRSACSPVLAAHIDTPDRETLRRFRAKSEGGMRGDIRHEAKVAKELIEARVNLSLQENAAAVLLANASNLYLNTTTDLPRTKGSPPPIEYGEIEKLARRTLDAANEYAVFLPERQADVLMAAYGGAPDACRNEGGMLCQTLKSRMKDHHCNSNFKSRKSCELFVRFPMTLKSCQSKSRASLA